MTPIWGLATGNCYESTVGAPGIPVSFLTGKGEWDLGMAWYHWRHHRGDGPTPGPGNLGGSPYRRGGILAMPKPRPLQSALHRPWRPGIPGNCAGFPAQGESKQGFREAKSAARRRNSGAFGIWDPFHPGWPLGYRVHPGDSRQQGSHIKRGLREKPGPGGGKPPKRFSAGSRPENMGASYPGESPPERGPMPSETIYIKQGHWGGHTTGGEHQTSETIMKGRPTP